MANNQQKLNNLADKYVESQKESVRIQEEYNAALKMSSSINNEILSKIDGQIDKRTTLGKKSKDYLNNLKSEISNLQTSDDISKQLVSIEAEKVRITKSYVGVNKELGQVYLEALENSKKRLDVEYDRLKLTEKVSEASSKLAESMGGVFDGLNESVKELPIFGKILGGLGDVGTKMLKEKLGNAAMKFTSKFRDGLLDNKSALDALKGASAGLGESLAVLANPYVLIGAAVLAVVAAGLIGFYKLTEAAKSFRSEIGLLNSQTGGLEAQIGRVYSSTAPLGASMDDVAQAATDFTREFSGIETASDATLSSIITLNKNFGVGTKEAAQLNKIFQNIGGLTAEQSQMLISQTVEMAKLANVAPKQVIQDMADSSEYAYKYFQGSPEALAKAAVQAAKLGTSIKQAGEVADNLLDFENSITKELEASAMLGTNLNLSQARYLAANGKVLEAQQSVIDQVANLGDLTKLNTFEQKALTDATGMQMDDLLNQQRIRKQFGKLNEEELATAMQVLKTGGDISKMGKEDLKNKTAELAKQQEMQSAFDKSANQLSAIGSEIMMSLMPVGKAIMDALNPIMQIVGGLITGFLKPFMAIIGNIFDHISKAFEPLNKMTGSSNGLFKVFEKIGEVVGFITSLFSGPLVFAIETSVSILSGFIDILGGIVKIFKGDFLEGLGEIGDGLVSLFFSPFIAGFNVVMDYLEGFFTIFESLGDWMHKTIIDPLDNFFGGIGSVFQSIASFATGGGETPTTTGSGIESVNDGVIQDGKVVSTNPEDTIFAMKKPETLANSANPGGAPTIDISALVNKMDEMIQAVSANRDVYMDREKVSSAVITTSEKSSQNRFGLMGA